LAAWCWRFSAIGESLRDRSLLKRIVPVWPLAAIAALLALYALSNRLAFGPFELMTIPVPGIFEAITSTFRASGRMFWPMFYLIFLGAIYVLAVRYPPRVAAGILGVLLVSQTADGVKGFTTLRAQLRERSQHVSALQESFGKPRRTNYRNIIYVPPQNAPRNYFDLAFYAAANRMGINVGAFARADPAAQTEKRHADPGRGRPRARFKRTRSIFLKITRIGLPPWRRCALAIAPERSIFFASSLPVGPIALPAAPHNRLGPEGAIHRLLPLQMGAPIAFDPQGNSKDYLLEGWSVPEPWGTWTDSPTASLGFHLEGVNTKSDCCG
jgi:hypothetical protein